MEHLVNLAYLLASCLLIYGLKLLGSPRTAPRGNFMAAIGMLIAIVAVLARQVDPVLIFVGILIGSAIGAVAAQKVKMTAIPQMVALFNGVGGAASAFVAASEFTTYSELALPGAATTVPLVLSTLIGWLTFTGNTVAHFETTDFVTDLGHHADKFVTHRHGNRNGSGSPFIPVINVYVGTANCRLVDADK